MISVTDDVTINLWSLRQQPASVAHRMQLKEEKYALVHTHTCTHTCNKCTHAHSSIHAQHTHTHTNTHIHTHMQTCTHKHIHIHIHKHTHTYKQNICTLLHYYSKILCFVHLGWPSVHTRMAPNGCMLVLIRVMYVLYVWRVWLCQLIPFPGTK